MPMGERADVDAICIVGFSYRDAMNLSDRTRTLMVRVEQTANRTNRHVNSTARSRHSHQSLSRRTLAGIPTPKRKTHETH